MAKAIPFLPARLTPSFCDIFMAAKSVHKKKLKKIKKNFKKPIDIFFICGILFKLQAKTHCF